MPGGQGAGTSGNSGVPRFFMPATGGQQGGGYGAAFGTAQKAEVQPVTSPVKSRPSNDSSTAAMAAPRSPGPPFEPGLGLA